ncbi:MAG: pyridoxine 5'-phosphate synthase [Candidatus Cloacimonetes bacterium]|nr:pyridoxine 5'-phosphate synthase [Candidatus Cloacimonadota bacterium]
MRKLSVKLDRIAGLRNLRDSLEPDPVTAAAICELNGADSISVRLSSGQVAIQPRDIKLLRETVQTCLNLEISNRRDYIELAQSYKPDMITIIPTYHENNVIQKGLKMNKNLDETVSELREKGFKVCFLMDPDPEQIKQAARLDIQMIEICTGNFAFLTDNKEINLEIENIHRSVDIVKQYHKICAVGHGIDYRNIRTLVEIKGIDEFRIGYTLLARAIFSGLGQAVRDLREIIG